MNFALLRKCWHIEFDLCVKIIANNGVITCAEENMTTLNSRLQLTLLKISVAYFTMK
jgi:hypothetical protein